jgi:hypothetical protein
MKEKQNCLYETQESDRIGFIDHQREPKLLFWIIKEKYNCFFE